MKLLVNFFDAQPAGHAVEAIVDGRTPSMPDERIDADLDRIDGVHQGSV